MAGSGIGWATGVGDTNHDVPINPAGLAVSGLLQVAPEFGYWLNSSLMLSLQIRYEYITGDDRHLRAEQCPTTSARRRTTRSRSSPRRPGSTARASSIRSSRWRRAAAASATSSVPAQRDRSELRARTTTRPASTRSAPGRCCSVRAAASCTTSPRRASIVAAGELGAGVPRFHVPPRRQPRRRLRVLIELRRDRLSRCS